MRRTVADVAAALISVRRVICWFAAMTIVLLVPAAAHAHEPAQVTIVAPREGSTQGADVEIDLEARGGLAPAEFQVALDGQPIDISGEYGPGAVFTSHRVDRGQRLQLTVRGVAPGEHELRLRYATDSDTSFPDVSQRFRTGQVAGRKRLALGVVGATAITAAIALVLLIRRLRARPRAGDGR